MAGRAGTVEKRMELRNRNMLCVTLLLQTFHYLFFCTEKILVTPVHYQIDFRINGVAVNKKTHLCHSRSRMLTICNTQSNYLTSTSDYSIKLKFKLQMDILDTGCVM